MSYDTVVVGGGIGGLSTAALLAVAGKKVLLAEKNPRLGGRAASYEYKEGFIVDWGIHLCRYGREGESATVLEELGEVLEYEEPSEKYYLYEDKGLRETSITELSSLVEGPITELLGMENFEDFLDISVQEWLSERTDDEVAREFFRMLSTSLIITSDIERASMGELARTLNRMLKAKEGSVYPVGGWNSIIKKLSRTIEGNGGEIRMNERVNEVIIEDSLAKGVKVGGNAIYADDVVLAIRHQMIDELVNPNYLPEKYLKRCKSLEPTAGISFDIGTSEIVTEVDGLIISMEVPLLGAIISNIDQSVSPDGKQLMTFLFVHSPEEIRKKEFAEKKVKEYRKIIHEMLPGLKDNVEWERVLKIECVDGSALTTNQHYKKRPGVDVPIENLYFASDTCDFPGGGGDISFGSAMKCAERILG